jgi:hypothetical protein
MSEQRVPQVLLVRKAGGLWLVNKSVPPGHTAVNISSGTKRDELTANGRGGIRHQKPGGAPSEDDLGVYDFSQEAPNYIRRAVFMGMSFSRPNVEALGYCQRSSWIIIVKS